MLDRQQRRQLSRVGRAAGVLAKIAGLITASVLASGCSQTPSTSCNGAVAAKSLRPQFHETSPNPHPDCLAVHEGRGNHLVTAEQRGAIGQQASAAQAQGCTNCACGGAGNVNAGAIADAEPLRTTDPVAPPSPAEDELQKLMDGNKRFVEGEAENIYKWARRPGEEDKRPPAAMVLACSDWGVMPEAAFDTRAGELFVVQVAGNVTDESVIESAKYAVQQYDIPLIIVLGHEHCGAVEAGLIMKENAGDERQAAARKTVPAHEAEARPAHDAEGAPESGGPAEAMTPVDRAAHANVNDAVEELREADPAIATRVAEGKLKIVGAFYDENNGQITLQSEHEENDADGATGAEQVVETPQGE
jgi:carbonic anhydrase